MSTALNARDWRDAALQENARRRRANAITTELLGDLDGLEMAIDGCVHFLRGGEGERVADLNDVRLSPQAKEFVDQL